MTPHLADTPVLETERLILRAPRMEDYAVFEAFYLTERSQFIGGPGTIGTAWRAFAHATGMWALRGFGSFVFTDRDGGRPMGMTGPWYPANWPEPEIGWTVWNAGDEGKGYAFEAATKARDFARDTLGWTTMVSYIDEGNDRSVALAERLGCTFDPDAPKPDADHPPILVYRHPGARP